MVDMDEVNVAPARLMTVTNETERQNKLVEKKSQKIN